jgi:hypothetical protein
MALTYRRDKLRDDLLKRWLPFIVETGARFHEHLPLIWLAAACIHDHTSASNGDRTG